MNKNNDLTYAFLMFMAIFLVCVNGMKADRRITALEARLSATNKAMETLYNAANKKADKALQMANLARLPGVRK